MGLYHWSRRQILGKVWFVRAVLLIVLGIMAIFVGIKVIIPSLQGGYRGLKMLWTDLPQSDGRTNFLILGIGGGVHEGPDLTDTMIVLSVSRTDGRATLITLPRDLWIESMRAKINTAYHYGEEKQIGGGFVLAKSAVFEALNLPIHKIILIDFSVFENVVDVLGGIDVNVGNAFIDREFPITGRENDLCGGDLEYRCRYETIQFEAGLQHMDGQTALKFVRSRHAEGDEGTDFARSRRQNEVIAAVKKKITLGNIKRLYDIFSQRVKTDIKIDELLAVSKLGLKVDKSSLKSINISEPTVVNPPITALYDYQWVLIPQAGDYKTIWNFVSNSLEK